MAGKPERAEQEPREAVELLRRKLLEDGGEVDDTTT